MAGRRGASTLSASAAATLTPKNEVRGSCSDSAWPAGRGALRASVAGAHGSDTKDESEHAMDRAEMHASAGALAGRHALASQIATAAQSGSGSQEYAAYASHGRLAVSAAAVSSSAYARPEPVKWNIRAPHAAAASSTHSADALDTALAAVAVASATEGKEAYDSGPATGLRSPLYMAWQKTKSVYGSSETSAASQSRSTLVSSPREDAATSSTAMRGAGSIMGVDLLRPPAIATAAAAVAAGVGTQALTFRMRNNVAGALGHGLPHRTIASAAPTLSAPQPASSILQVASGGVSDASSPTTPRSSRLPINSAGPVAGRRSGLVVATAQPGFGTSALADRATAGLVRTASSVSSRIGGSAVASGERTLQKHGSASSFRNVQLPPTQHVAEASHSGVRSDAYSDVRNAALGVEDTPSASVSTSGSSSAGGEPGGTKSSTQTSASRVAGATAAARYADVAAGGVSRAYQASESAVPSTASAGSAGVSTSLGAATSALSGHGASFRPSGAHSGPSMMAPSLSGAEDVIALPHRAIAGVQCVAAMGAVSWRGRNPASTKINQDAVLVAEHPPSASLLVAVFDGHGQYGREVSQFLRQQLPATLFADPRFLSLTQSDGAIPRGGLNLQLGSGRRRPGRGSAGRAIDEDAATGSGASQPDSREVLDLIAEALAYAETQLITSSGINCSLSGSTGTVALLRKGMVYMLNVGDSRCVIGAAPTPFVSMDLMRLAQACAASTITGSLSPGYTVLGMPLALARSFDPRTAGEELHTGYEVEGGSIADAHTISLNQLRSAALAAEPSFAVPSVKCRVLSVDHKPEAPRERQRINSSGGRVVATRVKGSPNLVGPPRVWLKTAPFPGLNMSRSYGDVIGKQAGVISVPHRTAQALAPSDQVLILGSDGLWDWMNNEEAVSIALSSSDTCEAASRLARLARSRWLVRTGGADDTTVVLVRLCASDGACVE